MEEMPLNIEKCDAEFTWKSATDASRAAALASSGHSSVSEGSRANHVSSSSTVITSSSASSCGRSSIMGSEIAVVASVAVKRDPPLEFVRTDTAPVNLEDEHHLSGSGGSGSTAAPHHQVSASTAIASAPNIPHPAKCPDSSMKPVSTSYKNNLVKGNSSRQGRSLQRWLVHSPTEQLVRQVAGTIPITRDGRVILVSASRKTEWILPKGGWDQDETKEQCATRETYEEAGLLGRLGGCLEPIDYETRKAKKRRLSQMTVVGGEVGKEGSSGAGETKADKAKGSKGEACEGMRPPLPKRAKTEASTSPTGPELTHSSAKEPPGSSNFSPCGPKTTAATATPINPKNYSYVRLFLFPLYVSSVKSEWPEKGRLRKLVDIDEAIRIMELENRPYFRRGLEMVKERGLHQPEQVLHTEGKKSVT